jgi:hypothetical protein
LSDTRPYPPTPSEETPLHEDALAASPYEPFDELPRRPRRRLLTPATVALMLVLFAACGFVGGVLVQKGQTSSAATVLSAGAGAGRFGTGSTGSSGARGVAGGGFSSRLGALFAGAGGAGGAGGATIGTVTNISGDKLYVTTAAGTMVEVVTTPESKVTKSESVGRRAVHPGDSVVVSGLAASNGTVTASSVTDSGSAASGSAASGFASLFGGGSASSGATSSSGGTASLFGG